MLFRSKAAKDENSAADCESHGRAGRSGNLTPSVDEQFCSSSTLSSRLFPLRPLRPLREANSVQRTANFTASRTAAKRLLGFAFPCHAMSSAVPWSTLVRMMGRPSVVFTADSNASAFNGM